MAQLHRPAAVDVGATEEDAAAWAEALDVDDSDLRLSPPSSSSLLRPSTTAAPHPVTPSPPSHVQRIPGPASAAQGAMRLRAAAGSPVLGRGDAQTADADFLLHPWLSALRFLGKDHAWEQPGIRAIKADQELDRAPLVAGVVTSCKPNGFGDLFLTLKDPTDTIGASVHRKVLSEGSVGQDISVGCAIILAKVAVFRPSHTACYLNITKEKVVKVMRKDCDPPSTRDISSYSSNLGLERSKNVPSYSASQQSLKTVNWRQRQGANLPMFERGDGSCTQASDNKKLRLADKLVHTSSKRAKAYDCYDAIMNTSMNTKSKHSSEDNKDIDMHDRSEPLRGNYSTSKPGEHQQRELGATNAGTVQHTKETSAADATIKNASLLSHPTKVVSVASVAGWTDEQLNELCVDF